jgi:hypothetical protein
MGLWRWEPRAAGRHLNRRALDSRGLPPGVRTVRRGLNIRSPIASPAFAQGGLAGRAAGRVTRSNHGMAVSGGANQA